MISEWGQQSITSATVDTSWLVPDPGSASRLERGPDKCRSASYGARLVEMELLSMTRAREGVHAGEVFLSTAAAFDVISPLSLWLIDSATSRLSSQ
ncbi:hypothetical protein GBAR_LOCUS2946 [Geodia barretti]|uniref:Uncharacterized protein n=1 Tax=Geodia barretti TaxID=519541 RepID=A0AA35W7P6_GEOBA|nr:hypothetical protein GBAR_LOCUS2946 [Geodia barretti]